MAFKIKKRVCFCDTDAGGVVYHSKYLDFFEQTRIEFFIAKGSSQTKLLNEYNLIFVIRECKLDFKSPAKLEDMLTITIENIDLKGPSMSMKQHIYCEDKLLVSCDFKIVAVNKINDNFKIMRKLPEEVEKLCATIS